MRESPGELLIGRMESLTVGPDSLGFYGLGQVGVAVRGPGGTIYIDPYLTDNGGDGARMERKFPPPVEPSGVTNASHVLVTHVHIDHFDPETLAPLAEASPEAAFSAPHTCDFEGIVEDASRVEVPEVGVPFVAAGAMVTAIPSSHTELEESEAGYPYLGYVVEWNGVTVYHSGDTVVYDGLIETLGNWDIDVMFIPINGRDYFRTRDGIIGNTDFREAAELALTLDVGTVVPTHYDMFANNEANPAHFVDYLYHRDHSRSHHLLRPGNLYYHVKEDG